MWLRVRVSVKGSQRDIVEVTQHGGKIPHLKTFKHTHVVTHGHRQTHADTHKPGDHKTSSLMKCSCEQSCIKGSMWSRAVVLRRRSGPDGVQVYQADLLTSVLISDFVTLLYILLPPLDGLFLLRTGPLFYFMAFLF